MKKMKGINLGNWLVLEKWMDERLFEGSGAEDETHFCKNLPEQIKRERLKTHRDTFITSRDFAEIASHGFDTLRLPVPYFAFEDAAPFVSCLPYIDRAFDWAEEYGLKLLLDLHTVPGGQNGTDNSGISGVCLWSTRQEYVDYTVEVLGKLAERYGRREALYGIEALNEPMCSDTPIAKGMNIAHLQQLYPPVDKDAGLRSENYPLAFLQDFYRRAYRELRRFLPADKCVVFHDAFSPELWGDFFAGEGFENIVLDTHQYLTMAEYAIPGANTLDKYRMILQGVRGKLDAVSARLPVIVGEWSLCVHGEGLPEMTAAERTDFYRALAQAYLDALSPANGQFYWTWKLNTDHPELYAWDAGRCLINGWLPRNGG